MSRSLTGIEEKVSKIETDTTEFFKEFQHFYRQYLKLLSYSIEQQLILAAHHICTEIYPDAFLRLTFNQRQRLQHRLHLARGPGPVRGAGAAGGPPGGPAGPSLRHHDGGAPTA